MQFNNIDWKDFFGGFNQLSVLDLGAVMHHGSLEEEGKSLSYYNLMKQNLVKIIGFEPDEEGCRKLNQEYGPPHRFFPYAIGDGQEHNFHLNQFRQTSSLFPTNHDFVDMFHQLGNLMKTEEVHKIKTRKLDDIEEITDVDYFKLDIQGAELMAMKNGSKVLAQSLIIQTEVEYCELYVGQPLFADVDAFLRSQGFMLYKFFTAGTGFYKPLTGNFNINLFGQQNLWGDAVYIRDTRNLKMLSVQKLLNFAVMAYDIFKAIDLTCLIFFHVDSRLGTNYNEKFIEAMTGKKSE